MMYDNIVVNAILDVPDSLVLPEWFEFFFLQTARPLSGLGNTVITDSLTVVLNVTKLIFFTVKMFYYNR